MTSETSDVTITIEELPRWRAIVTGRGLSTERCFHYRDDAKAWAAKTALTLQLRTAAEDERRWEGER